ncbi:hypothetical protein BHE74_00043765 [Ensete ventricosum]|nr:hypothetical protein BHE74_00043765 [Ensete ventricosum]
MPSCTIREHIGSIEVQPSGLHTEVHGLKAHRLGRGAGLGSSCRGAGLRWLGLTVLKLRTSFVVGCGSTALKQGSGLVQGLGSITLRRETKCIQDGKHRHSSPTLLHHLGPQLSPWSHQLRKTLTGNHLRWGEGLHEAFPYSPSGLAEVASSREATVGEPPLSYGGMTPPDIYKMSLYLLPPWIPRWTSAPSHQGHLPLGGLVPDHVALTPCAPLKPH